jgi:hypothetical protein
VCRGRHAAFVVVTILNGDAHPHFESGVRPDPSRKFSPSASRRNAGNKVVPDLLIIDDRTLRRAHRRHERRHTASGAIHGRSNVRGVDAIFEG